MNTEVNYSITADEAVICQLLGESKEVEITPVEFLSYLNKDLRQKRAHDEFMIDFYKRSNDKLISDVAQLKAALFTAENTANTASLDIEKKYTALLQEKDSEISELTTRVTFLMDNALAGSSYETDKQIFELRSELNKLKENNQNIVFENTNAKFEINRLCNQVKSLQNEIKDLEKSKAKAIECEKSNARLSQNKASAEIGVYSDKLKALNKQVLDKDKAVKASLKQQEKLERENSVLLKDNKKFKKAISDHKASMVSVRDTLKTASQVREDMAMELENVRADRRHLTAMNRAICHRDYFDCEEGGASLFSFQVQDMVDDGYFSIHPDFPIGIWLTASGCGTIFAISKDKVDGEYQLAYPKVLADMCEKDKAIFLPPAKYHNDIKKGLMDYDVKAVNESYSRCHAMISKFANYSTLEENALQTNKNLLGVSRQRRENAKYQAALMAAKSKRK